jgi:phospholipid/cholesterol/gamma-HCH transport system substrate-binding protein
MRANRTLEIGTGLFVLLGFAALLFLTTQLPASGLKFGGAKAGYHVTAEFDNIGDLKVGSPVTMSGVRIGEVSGIRFDPRDYKAVVTLRIDPNFRQIPEDSFASIQTQGLLGGKYIGISPGGADTYLKDNSRIEQTQSAIVLESLINKLFANFSSRGGAGGGDGGQAGGAANGQGGAGGSGQGGGAGNGQGGAASCPCAKAQGEHGPDSQGKAESRK